MTIKHSDIELYHLARPWFNYLRLEQGKFRFTKSIKGWHYPNVLIGELMARKIKAVKEQYLTLGATDIIESRSSKSVYFTLDNLKYRISDHSSTHFEGITILIRYDTELNHLIK